MSEASLKHVKPWLAEAVAYLDHSLKPLPNELNELDWKSDISSNGVRLAQHLSAFSNYSNGGYLAFGIDPKGKPTGLDDASQVENILNRLGNIARQGLAPEIKLDHVVVTYSQVSILFVKIPESLEKPVHLRGKGLEESFIRVAGQTRRMSKQELAQALLTSKVPRFEELEAYYSVRQSDVLEKLDFTALYALQGRSVPSEDSKIIDDLISQKILIRRDGGLGITNLGVLICAKKMGSFAGHERRGVRVIMYKGRSKAEARKEKIFESGYAVEFQDLVKYIIDLLPSHETISNALRTDVCIYPMIAIREILANAIIHQDFGHDAMSPMVEIFDDRMEITNPGRLLPSINVERLIDITPESRNENLARMMRHLGICEERGSGIDKALESVEFFGLPPISFLEKDNSFRVTLYSPRKYKDMSRDERILAAYQHACLKYVINEKMTNATLRKRLGITEENYPMVSRIIKDAVEAGKIKRSNPELNSKHSGYLPYWG